MTMVEESAHLAYAPVNVGSPMKKLVGNALLAIAGVTGGYLLLKVAAHTAMMMSGGAG